MSDAPKGSSFYLAMRLMPREKREAIYALYGVCRAIDDAVDDAASSEQALAQLEVWRKEVEATYHGSPTHPAAQAIAPVVQQYGLEKQHFVDMLDAFEMDAYEQMHFPSEATLQTYCYGVASCVGLLSLPIFGALEAAHRDYAITLGHGLQRINILRDIAEDAARGRCYLAKEWCVEPYDVQSALKQTEAIERLRQDAERYMSQADTLLKPMATRRPLLPAIMMQEVYRMYLNRMNESLARPRLSRIDKCCIIFRSIYRILRK